MSAAPSRLRSRPRAFHVPRSIFRLASRARPPAGARFISRSAQTCACFSGPSRARTCASIRIRLVSALCSMPRSSGRFHSCSITSRSRPAAILAGHVGAVCTCCWRRAEPAHWRAGSVRSATPAGMGRRSRRIPGSGIAHADERGADGDCVCLQPLLPSGATATVAEGELHVRVGPATLAWRPSPFVVTLGGAFTGVPTVETIDVAVALDASGLRTLTAGVGPAALDAGGVTLRPFARVAVGESPAGGRRIEIGLSADAGIAHAIAGRWHLDGSGLTLVAIDGIAESVEPARVASALVEAVIDIVASFALATPAVQGLLANPVGSTTVRDVLKDVVLDPRRSHSRRRRTLRFRPAPRLTEEARTQSCGCGTIHRYRRRSHYRARRDRRRSDAHPRGRGSHSPESAGRRRFHRSRLAVDQGPAVGRLRARAARCEQSGVCAVCDRQRDRPESLAQERAASRHRRHARVSGGSPLRRRASGFALRRSSAAVERSGRRCLRRKRRKSDRAGTDGRRGQGTEQARAVVQPGACCAEALRRPGARFTLGRRGQRPVVACDSESLRSDLHRTGRARRHPRRATTRAHLASTRRPGLALRPHRRR